jgi:hypothetical protein
MFRMTDHRIRKQITDKQTNAGEMIENKIGRYLSVLRIYCQATDLLRMNIQKKHFNVREASIWTATV